MRRSRQPARIASMTIPAASISRQRAPRHRLRIRAPALGLEILINMRGPPCGLRREEAAHDGEREQPRSVSVVIDDRLKSFFGALV
jgi:hypothetical protein